jgi:hypothetical protein
VALLDFSVLLTSAGSDVNVGQLDQTLEAYLLNGMHYDNLDMVSLTLLEGDSAEGATFTSTTVRFACLVTFNRELPPSSEMRAKQGYLLKDLPAIQAKINQNSALQGVTVVDTSFNRIDAASALPSEGEGSSGNQRMAILLGAIGGISVMAIAGALLIIRRRRALKPKVPDKSDEISSPDAKASKTLAAVKPGCASLISGRGSLGGGGGDMSTYMMTASPKRPEEISIRQSDDFDDYDDNYLTMDDEIKTTDGSSVVG